MGKCIVNGSGILVASVAYHLAKAGVDLTIVDRRDRGQATDAGAGIICPWLSRRRKRAWHRLAQGGARFYPKLIKDLATDGQTDTGLAQVGAIYIQAPGWKPGLASALTPPVRFRPLAGFRAMRGLW